MTVKGKQKLYIQKKKKVNIYYNKITLSKWTNLYIKYKFIHHI